jgi:hypothetical protein
MAQRKTPSTAGKKPGARPASGGPNARATGRPAPKATPGARPPRKPGKSIVNQKQTPWGLIITAVVLVLFAAGIVTFAVTRNSGNDSTSAGSNSFCTAAGNACYTQPEIPAAKKIKGIRYHQEPDHSHVTGTVKYDTSPPTGGNHNQFWANCTGTVYDHQIANENAVHMMEHGAVWITYNPKTATKADIATLTKLVDGVDRTALSPYAGLKTPISLQAWNYQLFVNKATDPRVTKFLDVLRYAKGNTPEAAASCDDPSFVAGQSTPGHPFGG